MRFFISLLLASLAVAQAQDESFFSVAAAYRASFTGLPLALELQGGGITGNFMYRVGADLPLFIFSGDASYIYPIESSGVRVYAGAGADVGAFVISLFGLHVGAGLEYKQDNIGIFGEYQLSGFVSGTERADGAPHLIFSKLKTGLNIYF